MNEKQTYKVVDLRIVDLEDRYREIRCLGALIEIIREAMETDERVSHRYTNALYTACLQMDQLIDKMNDMVDAAFEARRKECERA